MARILEVFFLPPMAIARVGTSPEILENFQWVNDPSAYGGNKTVIEPDVTLAVQEDYSLTAYYPKKISFKQQGKIKPVAPFYELWIKYQTAAGEIVETPLTLKVLAQFNIQLKHIHYKIHAANLKAYRRTWDRSTRCSARLEVKATEFGEYPLNGFSPVYPAQEPLVFPDKPIRLGTVQIIQPKNATALGVDFSVLRMRFIPAKGDCYGPPEAQYAADMQTGRVHEIVPPENRILNSKSCYYADYDGNFDDYDNTDPFDTYEGSALDYYSPNQAENRSWGVLDDTCDALLEAQILINNQLFIAQARVFVGTPDYAPDRRPLMSIADDFADRDLAFLTVNQDTIDETFNEVKDLFERTFETASMINLDAIRTRSIQENLGVWQENSLNSPFVPHQHTSVRDSVPFALNQTMPLSLTENLPNQDNNHADLPRLDVRSMTHEDLPYADKSKDLLNQQVDIESHATTQRPLPYTALVPLIHGKLTDAYTLKSYLVTHREHLLQLIRPAFGTFAELETSPSQLPHPTMRDPRIERDLVYDMRMPPYMRDAGRMALSLTRLQYQALLDLMDYLNALADENAKEDVK